MRTRRHLAGAVVSAEPERILFGRTGIGPGQIGVFLSNADGTGEHALLQPAADDYDPTWSPDGQWIAFTSERDGSADLYRVKPDGTSLERLTDSPAYDDQASFSPDGQQLVFVTTRAGGTGDLWILSGFYGRAGFHCSAPQRRCNIRWKPRNASSDA